MKTKYRGWKSVGSHIQRGAGKILQKKEIFIQKLRFKNGDIKIHQDKQKMRKSVVGRPALQEGDFRLK